jgi:hypothetical protein
MASPEAHDSPSPARDQSEQLDERRAADRRATMKPCSIGSDAHVDSIEYLADSRLFGVCVTSKPVENLC